MGIPSELVRAVREHRIVPFVGAGVSIGVKRGLFPSWRDLLSGLAAQLDEQDRAEEAQKVRQHIAAEDYLLAAEVAYRELGAYLFNGALRESFRKRRPTDGDLSAVEAIWGLKPPVVITTNYDDVLRWVGPRDVEVVANDQPEELELLRSARPDWPWIWHLHGTIQRLGTLILAGGDYRRLYGEGTASRSERYERAVFELHHTLASRPFLYIGFSLSDPYVLQQVADVLKLTKGKNAPSYALMKKGEGNRAALWSNYNIQLVEYEDHGRPLAELLKAVAEKAFPAEALTVPMMNPLAMMPMSYAAEDAELELMPEPEKETLPPPASHEVPRSALVNEYTRVLADSRRLLLLAPRRGGARVVARQIADTRFEARATWLSPPNVPSCTEAEYLGSLTGDPSVDDRLKLEAWVTERAQRLGGDHLIVLIHDGGPLDHLITLGNALRKLSEVPRLSVLVAGEARGAKLCLSAPDFSLFFGAPRRHVPPLTVDEVAATLNGAGLSGSRFASDVHRATGGHPGMVQEVMLAGDGLDYATTTARLSKSPTVYGVLRARLAEDDRKEVPATHHARRALADLLAGRAARALGEIEDDLQFPEVRLYYDGLVVAGAGGATELRCEAVRQAAERALAL